ncbi:hypothetical protein FOZ62_018678 [Perkinsus olseni]|uniref:Uncharacterized protein n=1 Tax=Perkinsus olseni TaxID=32597 RepID=A0A7J6Q5V7_PEROL|nr:hypothetical protein FOZ62_018678 [Perkinsus olseni]
MLPERAPMAQVSSTMPSPPPPPSSSSSTLAVPQTTVGGAESLPMRSALTVVPEDLPAIKYRHTMVLISRALYSRKIAELVCTSDEAMAVAHSRGTEGEDDDDDDDTPRNEHSAGTEGSSNSSVAATDGGGLGDANATTGSPQECRCTRRKSRRDTKKCYCSLSRSLSTYSAQQQSAVMQRQGTGPWSHNPSVSSMTSESALSLQDRGTTSLDLRRGFSGSMAVISRIAFESGYSMLLGRRCLVVSVVLGYHLEHQEVRATDGRVSHKYSSTIPKLTSFSAAINTCLIFVLAGDLPPSGAGPWTPSADLPNGGQTRRGEGSSSPAPSSSSGRAGSQESSSDISGVDLGICRVSAVEGVECGCFGFFGGHGRCRGNNNSPASADRGDGRSSGEVEVRDDERIEDDLRMLELRLRQWQRQRQHMSDDSKPLSVLLVISDYDRKMEYDREQHIFTRHERQAMKNKHTLLLSSVDSLWDKWGSRGERVLDDKIFTSWDGDKLHAVVTDLSTRLAHAYVTARPPDAV